MKRLPKKVSMFPKTVGSMAINCTAYVRFQEYFIRLILQGKCARHPLYKRHEKTLSECALPEDNGYLSTEQQLDLLESVSNVLETPMIANQIGYKKQPYVFRKSRRDLFSQLCDQFMIRRNYAKTFNGFKTRILPK